MANPIEIELILPVFFFDVTFWDFLVGRTVILHNEVPKCDTKNYSTSHKEVPLSSVPDVPSVPNVTSKNMQGDSAL